VDRTVANDTNTTPTEHSTISWRDEIKSYEDVRKVAIERMHKQIQEELIRVQPTPKTLLAQELPHYYQQVRLLATTEAMTCKEYLQVN
jgi:hypothetical protein